MTTKTHFLGQVTQKALIEREGKFLFIKYPDHKPHFAGYWDIPGGRLNENEKPLEGLNREVYEEVGVEIVVGDILATETFTNHSEKKIISYFSAQRFVTLLWQSSLTPQKRVRLSGLLAKKL